MMIKWIAMALAFLFVFFSIETLVNGIAISLMSLIRKEIE